MRVEEWGLVKDCSGETPSGDDSKRGHFRHVRFRDKRHGLAPPELAQREGHLDVAALFLRNRSESSGEGFVWQRKSYEAGRGMWLKHLSSTELPNVPVERPSICGSVYG